MPAKRVKRWWREY
jgi:hypothetical protein